MMVKPKTDKRERARELRLAGWSYSEIVRELECSKGSVSNWCKDIALSPEQESTLKERQRQTGSSNKGAKANKVNAFAQRREWQEAGRIRAKEGRFLHIVGCMLYWAEGSKSRRNAIHFANSDEIMMTIFLRFLREELGIEDGEIKVQIHCHTQNDDEVKRIENYWLDLLNLRETALYKTQILNSESKTRNRLINGVCSVRIHSTELLMHIFGAIQEYGNFINDDWLM